MANKYWVGGSGNWSDTDHWVDGGYEVVDSYDDDNGYMTLDSGVFGIAQSFTGDGEPLNSATFKLSKNGSPTGVAYAKIYAHTGTFGVNGLPTGSPLAVSDSLDASTIKDYQEYREFVFTGNNKITLSNGTKYVLSIEYSNGSEENELLVAINSGDGTHNGNLAFSYGLNDWNEIGGDYDVIFAVYNDNFVYSETFSVPTMDDNVFIDENSGFENGGTIVEDISNIECFNFSSLSGHNYTIQYDKGDLYVYGDFSGEPGLTLSSDPESYIYFSWGGEHTINSNGTNFFHVLFIGGEHTLTGNIESPTFTLYDGILNLESYIIETEHWIVQDNAVTINPGTSTIKLVNNGDYSQFDGSGKTYNNIEIAGDIGYVSYIFGSNTFNNFKINAGRIVAFYVETITTVSSFTAFGTTGNLITLDECINLEEQTGLGFTLSKASGKVGCNYLQILNSNATGGASWYAGKNSVNGGNNTGWIFKSKPNVVQSIIST